MLQPARRPILALLRPRSPSSSRRFLCWETKISDPLNQFQVYTSKSRDPFINLSIEHHLFNKSPPGSRILFLYTNRPCIVIGRNQNPWLEVNLALLRHGLSEKDNRAGSEGPKTVDLVRRRSGGGTVFHDEGNVNWSVICDFTEFTRDKHAEMVVRALRKIGIDRARVNERHDIVLDQGGNKQAHNSKDTHTTAYTNSERRPLKVSGSAYKMARNRALHHGTALLNSPNLSKISEYLHSPAKSFITAKGVESVSSPVANIGLANEVFRDAVRREFLAFYKVPSSFAEIELHDSALEISEIGKGYEELTSLEWTYLQTPQFSFSWGNGCHHVSLDVSHGAIKDGNLLSRKVSGEAISLKDSLSGKRLHEIRHWLPLLYTYLDDQDAALVSTELGRLLPAHLK